MVLYASQVPFAYLHVVQDSVVNDNLSIKHKLGLDA